MPRASAALLNLHFSHEYLNHTSELIFHQVKLDRPWNINNYQMSFQLPVDDNNDTSIDKIRQQIKNIKNKKYKKI